jgi:uncharacterized protein
MAPTTAHPSRRLLLTDAARPSDPELEALPPQAHALALGRLVRRVEHWRLFPELREEARYIDIETTGLEPWDTITTVGVSDGRSTCVLVKERGLTSRALGALLADARLLVTFNGTGFDLPRLRAAFPGLPWDLPHFDLAVEGRAVGLSGGLKKIERTLGVTRPRDLEGVTGLEAARLWRAYQGGDARALRRLVRYCRADVEALVALAPRIHARLLAGDGAPVGLLVPVAG